MTLLGRLARSRVVKTVGVILAITLAWQLYLTIAAPGRVDPALAAQVEKGQPLRISVEFSFPPERFHTLYLQQYGRVMGVEGNRVDLRDVRPESVGALARVYWIAQLTPLERDGAASKDQK